MNKRSLSEYHHTMSETYTSRGGVKLPLNKRPDQFVVRAQPAELHALGITEVDYQITVTWLDTAVHDHGETD